MASIENFKNLKHHTLQKKTLVLSVICSNCKKEGEKIFKEEESIEILKILGLIADKWLKKNKNNKEFRLKNIHETRNYFRVEIKQN